MFLCRPLVMKKVTDVVKFFRDLVLEKITQSKSMLIFILHAKSKIQ